MIDRRIIANLVVLLAIAVALEGYGVVTLFGSPFDERRTLVADLPDAGGLRTGFSVSHDGVVVGTVSKIDLLPGEVRVTAELDPGVTVPEGVTASVVRASAVGEQRLDLTSVDGGSQEALADGAEVPVGEDPIPPDVADVLETATGLIEVIPTDDLNTVIHEAAVGIDGRADELRSITASLTTVSDDVVELDPELRRLLDNGPVVLDDLSELSPELHRALDNTEQLTRILADRDDDLVALLGRASDLSEVGDRVVLDNRSNLTCLVRDLRDITGTLQGDTLANLDRGLATNNQFFGLIDTLAVRGPVRDVGYGPGKDDQLWLRTRLLVPPQTPSASAYVPPRGPRPVVTGEACTTRYGDGAAATPDPGPNVVPDNDRDPTLAAPSPAAAPPSAPPIDVGGVLGLLNIGQASPPEAANPVSVPLLILGVGILLALLSVIPTARTRRRPR